jgi:hypothetical protein
MRPSLIGVMWDTMSGPTLCFCGSSQSKFFYVFHGLVCADFRYSGAWLVASACMVFAFGREILEGLSLAAGLPLPERR